MRLNYKIMIMTALLTLCFSVMSYSYETNKFNGYGVQFDYPADYSVSQRQKSYAHIQLSGKEAQFILQIFNNNINDQLEKIYIDAFINQGTKGGAKVDNQSKSSKTLNLMDNTKKGRVQVKANYYNIKMSIPNDKVEVKMTMHIYFYNYAKKGYVFSYFHQTGKPKDDHFNTVVDTFTFLINS